MVGRDQRPYRSPA